jgi:hypothetical protein
MPALKRDTPDAAAIAMAARRLSQQPEIAIGGLEQSLRVDVLHPMQSEIHRLAGGSSRRQGLMTCPTKSMPRSIGCRTVLRRDSARSAS